MVEEEVVVVEVEVPIWEEEEVTDDEMLQIKIVDLSADPAMFLVQEQ